ncbi:metallophosphoesterase family protein [Fodinicurvata halophila]|uniref:Metallophosphoesterase family protein n=1 Tax=Fodinicurvata halophila TaxID=1419723 RepID=A0ABV8UJ20_9PROT
MAHISDIHLPPLPKPRLRELMNKRLLGWLSWQKRRRHIHRLEVLDRLLEDLGDQAPDHVAVTGDLVNLSLPDEFTAAARWLQAVGPGDQVSVVPGNHDAYVPLDHSQGRAEWDPYMTSDASGLAGFPYLRRRGPLALIGLSTAVATAPGLASGELGETQCRALEELLQDNRDRARVVLLHHSPLPGVSKARKALRDAVRLREILQQQGAELVLHGHEHRVIAGQLEGPGQPVPVIGAPSASALPSGRRPGAQYYIYGVEQTEAGWRVTVETRGYQPHEGRFIAVSNAPAILGALSG